MRALASLLFAIWATAASAQPPADGTKEFLFVDLLQSGGGVILCDTLEQIRDIAASEAPYDTYARYHFTPDEHGFSACVMAPFKADVVTSVDVGYVYFPHGIIAHGWAINVGTGVLWALYLEYLPIGSALA